MLKAEKDARREERAARPRAFQGRTHTAEAREKIRTAVIRRAALEKATPEERVVILTQEFEARLNKANRPIMPDYRGIAQRNKERAAQVEEEQASQQRAAKLALLHADWEANTQHALAEIDTEPRCTPNRVGPPPPNFIDLTDVAPEQMGKALTQHALGPMNGHYWSPQITYQRTYFLDRDTGEVVGVATYLANSVRKRVAHIGAFPGFTRGDTRGRQLVSFLRDGRFEPLATARLKTPINTRDNGTIIKFPTREKFEAEFATPAAAAMAERPTAAVHNPNSGPAAGAPDAPCYPSAIVTPPKPKRRFFPR
jgi:hypothetical protein